MAVFSAATAGTLLCPALSWNELSGRGEGTVQMDTTSLTHYYPTNVTLDHKTK